MLTRSQLLKLVGWDAERYKSLARRDLLPFADPDRDQRQAHSPQWRKFSPFEALLGIMSDFLSEDGGLSLEQAARIVNRSAQSVWAHWPRMVAGDPALWLGFVWRGGDDLERGFYVIGTMAEIDHEVRHGRPTEGGRFGPYADVSRMVVVNASRAAACLRDRAAEHSIDLDPEFWGDIVSSPALAGRHPSRP